MEKKKILFILIGLVVLLVFTGIFLFQKRKSETTNLSRVAEKAGISQEEKSLTYKDEAGFSFSHPESLTIKDVSGDDPNIYSSLELTSAKSEGKMAIKISDTSLASVDLWLKRQEASGAGAKRETILAGMPGSQIQFDNPKKLVTIAIVDQIMYFFESPLDEGGYWNKTHNQIVSSFIIGESKTSAAEEGEDSGANTIYEEEEVIE